jgi:hypothetical protein
MRFLPFLARATFATCATLALPTWAQVGITAPVRDFRFPMFNAEGARIWDLRGAEGIRRPDATVELRDMWLRLFERGPDGKPPSQPTIEVRSPRAILHEQQRRAEGYDRIEIDGPAYSISGNRWEFEGGGEVRRIRIGESVRVVFREQLVSILK